MPPPTTRPAEHILSHTLSRLRTRPPPACLLSPSTCTLGPHQSPPRASPTLPETHGMVEVPLVDAAPLVVLHMHPYLQQQAVVVDHRDPPEQFLLIPTTSSACERPAAMHWLVGEPLIRVRNMATAKGGDVVAAPSDVDGRTLGVGWGGGRGGCFGRVVVTRAVYGKVGRKHVSGWPDDRGMVGVVHGDRRRAGRLRHYTRLARADRNETSATVVWAVTISGSGYSSNDLPRVCGDGIGSAVSISAQSSLEKSHIVESLPHQSCFSNHRCG